MFELSDETHEVIKRLCKLGDEACDEDDYGEAVAKYREAWKLIPDPQVDWEASTWILIAIADAYIFNGDYAYSRETLEYAMHCPNALGNPYVHLRLGQVYYELDELDKAADELIRAYMGGGPELLERQPEKYINFLKTRIIIE